MNQPTKTCELTVRLNSGATVTGAFHVPYGRSSVVRPADAIRENESEFFLFSTTSFRVTKSCVSTLSTPREHRSDFTA